jgi:PEP-CTERM motif
MRNWLPVSVAIAAILISASVAKADFARLILDGPVGSFFASGHIEFDYDTKARNSIFQDDVNHLPDGSPTYVRFYFDPFEFPDHTELEFSTLELNTALLPGIYPNAREALNEPPGYAGIQFDRGDTDVGDLHGSFTITQSTFINGDIATFAADFVITGESPPQPTFTGQFYFNVVPEPSTLTLLALGIVGLVVMRWLSA